MARCTEVYEPHKTLYNRFTRWSKGGVFDRIFSALICLGLVGEYLGRLYIEAKARPLFIVSEVVEPIEPEIPEVKFPLRV